MHFRYVIIKKDGHPFGVIYFQYKTYSAYESLNYHIRKGDDKPGWFRSQLARRLKINGSVCGNTLLTGDNGFHLNVDWSKERQMQLVVQILDVVRKETYPRRKRPHFVLFKDYYENESDVIKAGNSSIYAFQVQPNMVFDFDDSWKNFDDYCQAMTSKYRVRLRKAIKRSKKLDFCRFDLDKCRMYSSEIHELYERVARHAQFNLFELPPNYWCEMMERLGEDFHLYVYRIEDEIVGFFTAIIKNGEVDAHFLGYDYDRVKQYDLYLNMLIKLVELGFETGKRRVVFSRTAMEIKSSVGAEPIPMYCYFQHDRWLGRMLFKYSLRFLNPTESWQQRHPFKDN